MKEDVDFYVKIYNSTGGVLSLCFVYFVGVLVDSKGPTLVLPCVLLTRSVSMLFFLFISTPESWAFYLIAPISDLSKYALIVCVQGYLYKLFPKDLRGIFSSLLGATSSLGLLMTKRVRGSLASRFGTFMPFIIGTLVDAILAVICLVLGSVGAFRSIDRVHHRRRPSSRPKFRRQSSKRESVLQDWAAEDERRSTTTQDRETYGGLARITEVRSYEERSSMTVGP